MGSMADELAIEDASADIETPCFVMQLANWVAMLERSVGRPALMSALTTARTISAERRSMTGDLSGSYEGHTQVRYHGEREHVLFALQREGAIWIQTGVGVLFERLCVFE